MRFFKDNTNTPEGQRYLAAVRNYTFVVTALSQAIFALTPFLLGTEGLSEAEVGLIVGAFALAQFLSVPIFGYLADRVHERRLLTVGGIFLLLAIPPLFFGGFAGWIIHRFLLGIGGGGVVVCLAGMAYHTTSEERAKGIAGVIGYGLVGSVMGLVLPTAIVEKFGINTFTVLLAVIIGALIVIIRRMPIAHYELAPPSGPRITATLLLSLGISFFTAASFLGFYLQAVLQLATLADKTSGLLLALATLLATFGSVIFRSRRMEMKNEGLATTFALAASAGVFLLPIIAHSLGAIFAILVLVTYLGFLGDAFIGALQSKLTPGLQGSALAMGFTAASLGRFVGASFVATAPQPFLITSGLALVGGLIALIVYARLNAELKNDRASR